MPIAALDALVAAIESRLDALAVALQQRDAAAIDGHAQELQRALTGAGSRLSQAAVDSPALPAELRRRIARVGARVALQRELLARSSAAVQREFALLVPASAPAAVYGQSGGAPRAAHNAFVRA